MTRPLPEPFIVFATQNPIEQEGTYPLPLAQLDRFMFKVRVNYPSPEEERHVLRDHHATGALSDPRKMGVQVVVSPPEIIAARQAIRATHVRDEVINYVQQLLTATRQDDSLAVGASPRSGLMLLMGAKGSGAIRGPRFRYARRHPNSLPAGAPASRGSDCDVRTRRHHDRRSAGSASGSRGSAAMTPNGPRAMIRPGPRLLWIAAAIPALATIYFVFPHALLLGLIVLYGLGVAAAAGYEARTVWRQLAKLQVRRELQSVVGRNLPFKVRWEISGGSEPLAGWLRDVVPAAALPRYLELPFVLSPVGQPTLLDQEFRIPIRGLHRFEAICIRLQGPWQLIEVQRMFPQAGAIKVLPEKFWSRDELLKDQGAEMLLLDKATRARREGSGTEFESLREYREGDDPLRIDWRATARLRRPVVRRFQIERHRDVMVLVDCGRLMGTDSDRGTKLDCAIDAALILSRTVLQSGDRCGLGLYDNELRAYLPPMAGMSALQSLAESVYDAQSEFRETDFGPMFSTLQTRQAKRSLIVVLSDVADVETSERFRASLARLKQRHVVLLAALRTPALDRVVREPVASLNDGARKAVTFRLLRERQQAIQSLRHGGVFVLDVEPGRLTVPLVNRFIELRGRNLL